MKKIGVLVLALCIFFFSTVTTFAADIDKDNVIIGSEKASASQTNQREGYTVSTKEALKINEQDKSIDVALTLGTTKLKTTAVDTGDATPVLLLIALMALSAVVAVSLIRRKKLGKVIAGLLSIIMLFTSFVSGSDTAQALNFGDANVKVAFTSEILEAFEFDKIVSATGGTYNLTDDDGTVVGFEWILGDLAKSKTQELVYRLKMKDRVPDSIFGTMMNISDVSFAIGKNVSLVKMPKTSIKLGLHGFKLIYDANGGDSATVPASAMKTLGNHTLSTDKPIYSAANENPAIVFIGWSEDEDDNTYSKDDSMPTNLVTTVDIVDSDVTVYAVWGYDINNDGESDVKQTKYTLTYDLNGGENGPTSPETTVAGDNYPISATVPEHIQVNDIDVVFWGWTTQTTVQNTPYEAGVAFPGTKIAAGEKIAISGNMTLTAVWAFDTDGDKTPDTEEDVYKITKGTETNGMFAITPAAASGAGVVAGTNVTITASPNAGYEVDTVKVYKTGQPTATVTVSGTGNSMSFTMPEANATVEVTFKKNASEWTTITFKAGANGKINGGTADVTMSVLNTTLWSNITAPTVTADSGYKFAGWEPILPWGSETASGAAANTYIAQYEAETAALHMITLVIETNGSESEVGGEARVPQYASTSEAVEILTKAGTGYQIERVTVNGKAIESPYTFTMPNEDVTVVVSYVSASTTLYDVTVNAGANGTAYADYITAAAGRTVTVITMPATGYKLKSVLIDGTPGVTADITGNSATFEMPARDVTVTVSFVKNDALWVTLTFAAGENGSGGGEVEALIGAAWSTVNVPTVTADTGWNRNGWSPSFPAEVPATDTTYTAQYTKNTTAWVTLTFAPGTNGTGGGEVEVLIGADWSTVNVPTVTANTGWIRNGWSPELPTVVPATDTTYTAQYTKDATKWVTLTFAPDANGTGGGEVEALIGAAWSTVNVPTVTANTGWNRNGWSPSFPAEVPATDTTYTAQYTKDATKWVTLTFAAGENGTGGEEVEALIGAAWSTVNVPTVTANTGWNRNGWSPSFPAEVPATDTTYTAQYTKNTTAWVTLTYNINDGNASTLPTPNPVELLKSSGSYTLSGKIPQRNEVGGRAVSFLGWTSTADSTIYEPDETLPVTLLTSVNIGTMNVNVYALWGYTTAVQTGVTYDANFPSGAGIQSGSVPIDNNTYSVGATVTVKANTGYLAKDGWIFMGWALEESAEIPNYSVSTDGLTVTSQSKTFSMYDVSVTLYGVWEKIGIRVEYPIASSVDSLTTYYSTVLSGQHLDHQNGDVRYFRATVTETGLTNTVNWTVDSAAGIAGVTITPQTTNDVMAALTFPTGYSGSVTVTVKATDDPLLSRTFTVDVNPTLPTIATGRTLDMTTGLHDDSDWIEIATIKVDGEDYSLIVRKNVLPLPAENTVHYGLTNNYINSNVQGIINTWFTGLSGSNPLASMSVQNNAMSRLGTAYTWVGDGISTPNGLSGAGMDDTAFALSSGEAVMFISVTHLQSPIGYNVLTYGGTAQQHLNWKALGSDKTTYFSWLRSVGASQANSAAMLSINGYVSWYEILTNSLNKHAVRPALWVKSEIFA